jgi:hypothetical protein
MMSKIKTSFAAFALLLLAGCASLGLAPAKSFDDRLAYAYGTHTAVLESATAALKSGAISVDDAQAVLSLADESRTLLDAARAAVGGGDTSTAEGKLALALSVLTQLQTYLQSKGVK